MATLFAGQPGSFNVTTTGYPSTSIAQSEERYQTRSTLLTSQIPVASWHEQIGDATIADGILDRLVHNAHRIEMSGDSMRRAKAAKAEGRAKTGAA